MSNYLDDMIVQDGDKIVCAGNIAAKWFTEGKAYIVNSVLGIRNDNGEMVKYPSARFKYLR